MVSFYKMVLSHAACGVMFSTLKNQASERQAFLSIILFGQSRRFGGRTNLVNFLYGQFQFAEISSGLIRLVLKGVRYLYTDQIFFQSDHTPDLSFQDR